MNHHQRHTPPGAKRTLHFFALLFAAVLLCSKAAATFLPRRLHPAPQKVTARGYLVVGSAPELRFQEAVPPAVRVTTKPTASSASPAAPIASRDVVSPSEATTAVSESAVPNEAPAEEKTSSKTRTGPPGRIIPDATRPVARPEDFLPFFRFPSAGDHSGRAEVLVPVPPATASGTPLPPSSATYTQSPK